MFWLQEIHTVIDCVTKVSSHILPYVYNLYFNLHSQMKFLCKPETIRGTENGDRRWVLNTGSSCKNNCALILFLLCFQFYDFACAVYPFKGALLKRPARCIFCVSLLLEQMHIFALWSIKHPCFPFHFILKSIHH